MITTSTTEPLVIFKVELVQSISIGVEFKMASHLTYFVSIIDGLNFIIT